VKALMMVKGILCRIHENEAMTDDKGQSSELNRSHLVAP